MIRPVAQDATSIWIRHHGLPRAIGPSAGQIASLGMEDSGEMQAIGLLTIPAPLHDTILGSQVPEPLLPQGPILEGHRMEGLQLRSLQLGQAPEAIRLGRRVVEGHLLDGPQLGSLQPEGQAMESTRVQCQALLLMIASRSLTWAFRKGVSEDRKDLRDHEGPRVLRGHKGSPDSPDHKVNQVSPDYPDCKDSRDHKDNPGSLGHKGHKDHKDLRDHKDYRGRKGRKGRGDREGHEGQ